MNTSLDRRAFLAAAFGASTARFAVAQAPAQQPQVSSTPSQRDFSRQDPVQYPDPDIIALDNRFRRYIVGNTVIRRHHFGTLWAEGPAWNGVGRYRWERHPNNADDD
jgi:gluconolactonase